MLFDHFINLNTNFTHHAVLLISKQFEQHAFPDAEFLQIANEFCGIKANKINNFAHPDILIIDRERRLLRLEDVNQVKEFSLYPPQLGKRRLILIEKCERLNLNSANFLLKLLEEPSANVLFLLTTAQKHLVLPTVLSRLQKFNVQFKTLESLDFIDQIEKEDANFFEKIIYSFSNRAVFVGTSLSDKKTFSVSPTRLLYLIEQSEIIAKKYTAEQLQAILLYWVSDRLKKEKSFVIIARFIMAHVRNWKQSETLNPSSQFWLLRIFLGQHNYENN